MEDNLTKIIGLKFLRQLGKRSYLRTKGTTVLNNTICHLVIIIISDVI